MTGRLSLRGIRKDFGREPVTRALDSVDLDIQAGEYVALTGESGSGKSTLLSIVGLLDTPTSGTYEIAGKPSARLTSTELARARSDGFAHVFQAFHLLERRPAVDSVGLGLLYRGLPPQQIRERSETALESLGLLKFARTRGALLSGGQRQRVAIGRALAAQAPVLLADEPTGNLDSQTTAGVLDALDQVHASGTTVVVVTHSDDVAARAGRVIRMEDGHLRDTQLTEAELPRAFPTKAPGQGARVHPQSMLWDIASNLASRIGRSASLVAAVGLAVGLVVTTLGLSFAANQQVSDVFDVATSREVTVSQRVDEFAPALSNAALERVRQLNGVVAVADATDTEGSIQRSVGQEEVQAPWFHVRGDVVFAGRATLSSSSVKWTGSLEEGTALVGEALAIRMDLPGASTSPTIFVNGEAFEVRGIITQSPRQPGWIGGVLTSPPANPIRAQVDNHVLITTQGGAGQQVASEVALAIDPVTPEAIAVTRPPDPAGMRQRVQESVQTSLTLLTATALLVSTVSLTLSSLAAASERRVEFGLRRALGARARHIVAMLAAEATLTGVAGGVIGLAAGLTAILCVTILNRWTPVFDAGLAGLALGTGVAVSIVGSTAGALRGLRVQPNAALKPSH